MMRHLLLLSLIVPATSLGAMTESDCTSKLKVGLPVPSYDQGKIKSKCSHADGEGGSCGSTYKSILEIGAKNQSMYSSACTSMFKSQTSAVGDPKGSFLSKSSLNTRATDAFTGIEKEQDSGISSLTSLRTKLNNELDQDVRKAPTSEKVTLQQKVAEFKGIDSLSDEDYKKKVEALKSVRPAAAQERLAAGMWLVRYRTALTDEKNSNTNKKNDLVAQNETLGGNVDRVGAEKKGGDSPLSMISAAAPLAAAGLSLMQAQNASTASATDTSSLSSASAGDTSSALKNAASQTASLGGGGGSSNSPSFGAGAASKTPEPAPAAGGHENTPAFSVDTARDPAASALSAFNGSLGGSPFSGSSGPTSAGGASGGGGLAKSGETTSSSESAEKKKEDHGMVIAAGGGMPSFGGGAGSSASASATPPDFKDLFKTDNPFAALGADGKPALNDAYANAVLTDTDHFAGLANESSLSMAQSGITNASDLRTLFERVREFHKRCQKKGCVTSEAGGKI